eukprot:scaffold25138_cov191-Cylindrotheca_fusiformis.AAC.1
MNIMKFSVVTSSTMLPTLFNRYVVGGKQMGVTAPRTEKGRQSRERHRAARNWCLRSVFPTITYNKAAQRVLSRASIDRAVQSFFHFCWRRSTQRLSDCHSFEEEIDLTLTLTHTQGRTANINEELIDWRLHTANATQARQPQPISAASPSPSCHHKTTTTTRPPTTTTTMVELRKKDGSDATATAATTTTADEQDQEHPTSPLPSQAQHEQEKSQRQEDEETEADESTSSAGRKQQAYETTAASSTKDRNEVYSPNRDLDSKVST